MALLESFTYLSMKGKRQSKGEKKLNLRTKKATHQWQKQKNDWNFKQITSVCSEQFTLNFLLQERRSRESESPNFEFQMEE